MAKKNQAATAAVPLKLQGKSVFPGGNLYHQTDAVRSLITLEGGTVAAELTDKTDIVVLGYSGAANPQKKAAKLNAQGAAIQVLTIDQFGQLVKPTPDEAVQLLLGGNRGIERWNSLWNYTNQMIGYGVYRPQAVRVPYIRGADFARADLSNAFLFDLVEHSDFTGANLTHCHLNLAHCQLNGATLDGVVGLTLDNCTAEGVDFSRTATQAAQFASSNLKSCSFARLAATGFQFKNCQLDGADFSAAQMTHTAFHSCSLKNATFTNTNLEEADFTKADLSGADFTNANLKLAKFSGAIVDGADFTGATMVGADVGKVNFSKAKGFDPVRVQVAGGPGPAVQEFLKLATQANVLYTSLTVITPHPIPLSPGGRGERGEGEQAIVLSLELHPNWIMCRDSTGNNFHSGQSGRGAAGDLCFKLATKWHGSTPDLPTVTARGVNCSLGNKELKQIALRAWCELFGIDAPSEQELRKSASSSKAQKKQQADDWLAVLRNGKKGIEQWNGSIPALAKIFNKQSGIDLANARLSGITLQHMEWKSVNFAGADLAKSEVLGCRFPEGNFAGASLKAGRFLHSSFNDANLENADASAADLEGASFKRANCKNAKFAKASLQGADLCGADLTDADLSATDLTRASYDEHTRWPRGFTPTLEMVWKGPGTSPAAHQLVQSTKPRGKLDIEQFMTRLEELCDTGKLAKALSMLKADRFRLYAQVNDDHFVGVVKSQSDSDLVYSCRLNADGTYACCTQNLNVCGGLRGSLCKHLLVLIVGLTRNNELDPNVIDTWIRLSKTNKPALDKDAMSETLLRYKGAEAGEVDWRPTETIPEDYYAM